MQVALASRCFPTARGDEDFTATEEVVAVPDGATVPPGLATGCIPGTSWFVRRLGARLFELATDVGELLRRLPRAGDRQGCQPSTGAPATRCLFPEPAP
jgi:hypothetical protein